MNRERLVSVDAFRGATVAGMILVNNPGDWGHIYDTARAREAWHGWTPTDLIFPFFLFVVGVVPRLLFARHHAGRGHPRPEDLRPRLLHGLLSAIQPRDRAHSRGPARASRLCYFARFPHQVSTSDARAVAGIAAACLPRLLVPHDRWSRCRAAYAPNLEPANEPRSVARSPGFRQSPVGVLEDLGSGRSALVPPRTWHHTASGTWRVRALPRPVSHALGNHPAPPGISGVVMTAAGLAWDTVFPINKSLWTSSYVLFTAGLASIFLLAGFYWVADVKRPQARACKPLRDLRSQRHRGVRGFAVFSPRRMGSHQTATRWRQDRLVAGLSSTARCSCPGSLRSTPRSPTRWRTSIFWYRDLVVDGPARIYTSRCSAAYAHRHRPRRHQDRRRGPQRPRVSIVSRTARPHAPRRLRAAPSSAIVERHPLPRRAKPESAEPRWASACLGIISPVDRPREERELGVPERLSPWIKRSSRPPWVGPCAIENDANCFALSEASDGAAAGTRACVFGAILGTGTGGGVVVNGRDSGAAATRWAASGVTIPLPWPERRRVARRSLLLRTHRLHRDLPVRAQALPATTRGSTGDAADRTERNRPSALKRGRGRGDRPVLIAMWTDSPAPSPVDHQRARSRTP
jgi:hypothetical protein